jgi:L-threonylcarbamoyladenylate synthase
VTADDIERAAERLVSGGLVAVPTETVYGLGAWALDTEAVARVFAVKGRPPGHPLIVHIANGRDLERWAADVPESAARLAAAFWPGPLTLVLPRSPRIPDVVTGGRPTVGLRVPDHPVALALLAAIDRLRPGDAAIAAPSANRFGRVSPTTAAHVRADLGDDVDLVLDGGPCAVGVESTIVDLVGDQPEVLRLGGVDVADLADVLGVRPQVVTSSASEATMGARAPGMLASHYAPRARLVLVEPGDGVAERVAREVARGAVGGGRVAVLAPEALADLPADAIELEPTGPPEDYARVLYDRLRQADRLEVDVIVAVAPAPGGLGDAVRDRLTRAAYPTTTTTTTTTKPVS